MPEPETSGSNTTFPKFQAGDNASKILSASYQTKVGATLGRLSQWTFGGGADSLSTGPASFSGKHQRNTVLVVKVPDGGIPARSDIALGTAECELFSVIDGEVPPEANLEADLSSSEPVKIQVYNTSESEISSSVQYVQVHLSRGGYWLVITGGGETGIVHFTITEFDCTDIDEHGHHYATAIVTYVACGLTSPEVDDEIDVYDLMGCWLTDSQELLIARAGIAFKVAHETAYGTCDWSIMALCASGVAC